MALPLRLPAARSADPRRRPVGLIVALLLAAAPAQAQFFWDRPEPKGQGGQAAPRGEGGPRPSPVQPRAAPAGKPQPIVLRKSVVGGLNIIENSATLATVFGLKGGKGSFLSVRVGPDAGLREIERLTEGRMMIPIAQDNPEWFGVVYAPAGLETVEAIAAACRIDEAAAATLPEQSVYRGPCKSGWVNRRWVKLLVD
ncbi:MAG: hypothetical protein JNK46_10235 [Methylobacteriaceae bacterium]|nr:hypothetical protein [Methylobacteriaceae bacterium]